MRQSLFHCYAPTVHSRIVYVYCYYQTLTVWLGGIGDFSSLKFAKVAFYCDRRRLCRSFDQIKRVLNKAPNVTKNRYVRR